MNRQITPVNGMVDVERLFNLGGALSLDAGDLEVLDDDNEYTYSFVARGGYDEILEAIDNAATFSPSGEIVLRNATKAVVVIRLNPDAEQPLLMNQATALYGKLIEIFHEECEITTGTFYDGELGNEIAVDMLVNAPRGII